MTFARSLHEVRIAPDPASWRAEARALLRAGVAPDRVMWRSADDLQESLIAPSLPHAFEPGYVESLAHVPSNADALPTAGRYHVPKAFMRLAKEVASHRDPSRWDALYRVLWRLTHGERALLEVATDPDIHRVATMSRSVRRAVHKMHAFVRFRAVTVSSVATGDDIDGRSCVAYVAWFEPPHPVVELASPFFARRFPSMRWSVLTPDRCAHWDGEELSYTAGVSREMAPTDDSLEALWRTYYASIFNPARLALAAMKSEMPKHYWAGLPEASLIPSLTRDAPARVARMLEKIGEPAEALPEDLRAAEEVMHGGRRMEVGDRFGRRALQDLDAPGAWDPVHDPGATAASARAARVQSNPPSSDAPHLVSVHDVEVRVGTASWTDPTLLQRGVFYPDGITSAEERLRYYASRFPLVEVDSTYYAMPVRSMAAAWAARSPESFVFDMKAFALMTGHAAETKRLPDWLRRALTKSTLSEARVRAADVPSNLMDEVWARYLGALSPLREAGKLGPVLLQYPRWFAPTRESADALRAARERLGDHAAAVEFRNPAWVTGRIASRTFALLEQLAFTYVVVDAPPGTSSSMPPTLQVTTPGFAMVRLHGRRSAAWEAKHAIVSERYRYLYDGDELGEWTDRIAALASRVRESANSAHAAGMPDMAKARQGVHVVYNNCHANYGTTNASEITELLIEFDRERRLI